MAPEPWLDLSTGINPFSYPVPDLPEEVFTRLPEPSALTALEQAAGKAYGAPPGSEVVAAPGTQAMIGLLPRIVPARRIGILGFTYREHECAWRAAGSEVTIVEDLAALEAMDVAIVVNPNNPDGRLVAAEDLRRLAESLGRRGGLVVVDEAFVDFLGPDASLVPLMPPEGALVLRSFGKTYGLPGLRLGFAVTGRELAARLRGALGPWPVSGAALTLGRQALADADWLAGTREMLVTTAAALDDILADAGFSACGGTPLFRLVAHRLAPTFYGLLGRAGILVRRFPAKPCWLRLGLPPGAESSARLRAALVTDPAGKQQSWHVPKNIEPFQES